MLFNSFEYIFAFLPLIFLLYFALAKVRIKAAKIVLILASLFFYAWWKLEYVPILLGSIIFNFTLGNLIREDKLKSFLSKKSVLIFGIAANLALLGYYKYADFFIENVNNALGKDYDSLNLLLPLAISFFTFQQITYLVDSYKGDIKKHSFLSYSLFVTFFPQLIAGPIVHHKEMIPQFESKLNWVKDYKNIVMGLFIFSIGLFKKVMIADQFAVWATAGFDGSTTLSLLEAWATSLSYTFQLYFDFSGYTDMAIGAALLFNIKLPFNFNSPYKALNIQNFWRRWHMTLTRFLTEYIYIPLGGNRHGTTRTTINIMLVFLIGGMWHGAGWTFIFWGFLHGLALIIHRTWVGLSITMPKWIAWFITFNFVNVAWVFFRAKDFEDALKVLKGMFSGNLVLPEMLAGKLSFLQPYGIEFGALNGVTPFSILFIVAGFIVVLFTKNTQQQMQTNVVSTSKMLLSAILFTLSVLSFYKVSEFIYFNF
ncbi:MAG TPA: MBOAT family protein [Leucothrix sp.]|nr:MBOAT family protein [Leucothrix sp.]